MKRIALTALLVLALAGVAHAELKIGYVDLQQALNDSKAGKAAKVELEALAKTTREAINDKVAKKDKLIAELEKQSGLLSADARTEKANEVSKLEREISRMIEDANSELQKKQRKVEIKILGGIKEIIDETGKSEGYTIILPSDVIIFSTDAIDITDEVLKKYDKKSGGKINID